MCQFNILLVTDLKKLFVKELCVCVCVCACLRVREVQKRFYF
jgi:hypothetical protein